MNTNLSSRKSPLKFFLLVYVLSIPFWLIGFVAEYFSIGFPNDLPVSSLMFMCPMIAALIFVYREDKIDGIKALFKRVFDYKRIKMKVWYLSSIFLMPILMLLSYWVMRLIGLSLPKPYIPFLTIPILFIVFFVAAIGEEAGWMGYAITSMQDRWSALKSSIIMGVVWATWHVIPYVQAHSTLTWIAWQCLFTIAMRILIVWLYNNTQKSILPGILLHTMYNVSYSLFPNYGSNYNPAIFGSIVAITAIIVTLIYGSKTLSHSKLRQT